MLLLEVGLRSDVGTDKSGHNLIALVNYLSKRFDIAWFLVALILTAIFFILGKIVSWILKKSLMETVKHNSKFTPMLYALTSKVCVSIIWIIIALCILQCWGIDLTPILAGLGITGIVLGFALQESVSSFFSGLLLAVNRPFRIGDWVDIGGVVGTVMAMDTMCVTLASPDNKKIVLNNKNVWGNTIVNYSYTSTRRIDMTVSVKYGSDLEKTKEVLTSLLKSYPEVLEKPEIIVEINSYSSSSIDFVVRPWVNPKSYWTVYWRFYGQVLGELEKNGIFMPYNQVDVHVIKDEKYPKINESENRVNEITTPPPTVLRPSLEETLKGMGTKDPEEILESDEEKMKLFNKKGKKKSKK